MTATKTNSCASRMTCMMASISTVRPFGQNDAGELCKAEQPSSFNSELYMGVSMFISSMTGFITVCRWSWTRMEVSMD